MKAMSTKRQGGFTIVETLVSVFIFALLSLAVYEVSYTIIKQIGSYRENTTISGLADQYLEIARNLPYSEIGTISGNPHGNLPDLPNKLSVTFNNIVYDIFYSVTYVDDPADGTILAATDFAPNDYKQIKLYVRNTLSGVTSSFLSTISPKGLESLSSGGALSIKVFDAVGQPIPNATINITNTTLIPSINLTRTSDSAGNWIEVGLPDSANSYHITVSKPGYSTESTYASTPSNPDPTKPNATILNGQVTQVSFSIDKVSTLTFNTYNQVCAGISGVGVEVKGSKLIGTPDVVKFDTTYTSDGAGHIPLNNIEWDNYTPALTGNTYMIFGSSPIQQINLLPNTTQQFTLILGPRSNHSLLVIVKDASTGVPLENATVRLENTTSYDETKLTGGSIWQQEDWSGGFGQADFTDTTQYYADDGNIDTSGSPGGVRLSQIGSEYVSSGALVSSTFDTGTNSSSYTTLSWLPTSQDASTTIRFQIASNNDNATWDFTGPDGATTTFYTVPGTTISSTNNNHRYVRYKVYLDTLDKAKTPVLTSVSVNYVSGCFTPGQVMFDNLNSGSDYTAHISMPGYTSQDISSLNISGYNVLPVLLGH